MRRSLKGIALVSLGLLCSIALSGLGQQTAATSRELQNLLINEQEVRAALGAGWSLVLNPEVTNKPENSIAAARLYSDPQTSLLAVLYQFELEDQAHEFFATPAADSDKVLSREDQETLDAAFKVGQEQGAAEVELVKIRLGNREELSKDDQQLVLRFRVGRTVFAAFLQLCIAEHVDGSNLIPYQCFDEARLKEGLIKAGQKQLEILYTGR